MTTFADQFQSTNGAPIRYDGRELHAKLAFQVKNGDTIELRFLRSAERPVQGIGITCEKCEIRVASTTAKRIGLWADTAPRTVTLEVVKARTDAHVIFFNQWRDEKYGSTMYRVNNAAMELVPQPDASILVRCSDGWGEPDFNDLVFQIVHRQ
ncbi:hypothetical protein [Gemmatimonas aurantiaca]|uniref:hypothetical protein n=1 Tax=Gemmatimonas aurantiaca TaxID=173480 RepID=UPI00301DBB99